MKVEQVAQHLAFDRQEVVGVELGAGRESVLLMLVDRLFQLFAKRRLSTGDAKRTAQPAEEADFAAGTRRVSHDRAAPPLGVGVRIGDVQPGQHVALDLLHSGRRAVVTMFKA